MNNVFFFLVIFGAVLLVNYFKNISRNKNYSITNEMLSTLTVLHLQDIKCETFCSGAKGRGYYFSYCELFVTEDALIIFGTGRFKWFRQLTVPLILTSNPKAYLLKLPGAKLIVPKNLNLNSFNGDIYIEFVEPGFINTHLEFRLKNISAEIKERLLFLNYL